MEKINLDKNYNPFSNNVDFVYQDHLFDTVEEIKIALDNRKITKEIASILLNILINKEARKESAGLVRWISKGNRKENTQVLINVFNSNIKYA